MALVRYLGWLAFVGCSFFALSAHSYYFFTGWEAAGAGLYGSLLGLGFAFSTKKGVSYPLLPRLLIALVWIMGGALSYRYIFGQEIGQYTSRNELIITGALLAALPATIWLARRNSVTGVKNQIG